MKYFISHASEDKAAFVRLLANKMIASGAPVFYDEYSINLGDSIFESINRGIQEADIAVIVLSPAFIKKDWTKKELNSIFNKHVGGKCKFIPVFYNILPHEVSDVYPLIADILGVDAQLGVNTVSDKLLEAGGITPKPQHAIVDYSQNPNFDEQRGWTIALGNIFLQELINPKVPKVLYDLGLPNEFRNRVTIYIERGEFLIYKIIDNSFKTISLSSTIDKLDKKGATIFAQYCKVNNVMRLVIENEVIDEIQTSPLNLPKTFLSHSKQTIGCSLEIDDPCSFYIGNLAYSSHYLSLEEIKEYIDMNLNNTHCLRIN